MNEQHNPPAFPRQGQIGYDSEGRPLGPYAGHGWASEPQDGLTMRDWFAGRATEKDIEAHTMHDAIVDGSPRFIHRTREEAKFAYADAMLAARKETK